MRFPQSVPLAAIAAIGFAPFLPAAEPALARLVPADVALVVALNDLPRQRQEFPASNVGRAWNDPDIARFFAPLASHPKLAEFVEMTKSETGYAPLELLAFATGDILVAVPVSSVGKLDTDEEPGALIAVDVGENEAKLRDLIAEQSKKDEKSDYATEDYNGATLHVVAPKPVEKPAGAEDDALEPAGKKSPGFWALHQGRWFISNDRALVTGALDALAAGGLSESLAASADYQKIIDRAGGRADGMFFFNWKAVYPALLASIEAKRDPQEAPNPFGFDPANILRALGLDAIETFSLTYGADGGTDRIDGAITVGEMRGLVALAAYRDGPVARPDWVPAAWFDVSSQNFSVSAAYAELESILDRVSPMVAGMAQGKIKTFERQLNLDLKRDLVGSLGESFVSGYSLPAGADAENPPPYEELDQFIAISLADAATFERAIDTIKARFLPAGEASPLKTREYLGRNLHTVESPAGGRGFSYAISDGWLLLGIGSPSSVESVLQLMNAPNPAASFWQRADVREALDPTPAGAFHLQHTELAPIFASLAATLIEYQENQDDEESRFVDPAARPTRSQLARFFKHSVSHGTRASDGFHFHSEGPAR